MSRPQALIFDLLTALLDSWSVWDKSIPESEKHITSGHTWRKRYLDLTYGCGEYVDYEALVERSAVDTGLSTSVAKSLIENWDSIKPWPEVPQILGKLKKHGYKLAIVTNCSNELGMRAIKNCEASIKYETGESFEFDALVTAEESGYYKPNPKPYQDVLKKIGVDAEDAIFVAGSSADLPGATGVGMKVVWNNHAGLEMMNDIKPWREGMNLDEALGDISFFNCNLSSCDRVNLEGMLAGSPTKLSGYSCRAIV